MKVKGSGLPLRLQHTHNCRQTKWGARLDPPSAPASSRPLLQRPASGAEDANRIWRPNTAAKDYEINARLSPVSGGAGRIANSRKKSGLIDGLTQKLRQSRAGRSAPVLEQILVVHFERLQGRIGSYIQHALQNHIGVIDGDRLVLTDKTFPYAFVFGSRDLYGFPEIDTIHPSRIVAVRFAGGVEPIGRSMCSQVDKWHDPGQLRLYRLGRSGCEQDLERCQVVLQAGAPVSMSSTRSATTCRSPLARRSNGFLPSNSWFGIRNHFKNPFSGTTARRRATRSKNASSS